MGLGLSHILWKNKSNVWNHQPDVLASWAMGQNQGPPKKNNGGLILCMWVREWKKDLLMASSPFTTDKLPKYLRTGSAGCLMEILTMGCILIELVNWNTMQLPSIKRIYPHGTQVFKWVVCRSTWPFQTISSVKISKEHQPSSTFWTAQRLNPHRKATARMAQTLRLPQAVPTRKRRKVQFWSSESRPRPSKDWPPSTRAGWEEALGFSWWWFFGKNEQGWC